MNKKAIAFAIEAHEKVNHRYDGKPYSVHLAIVAGFYHKFKHTIPKYLHSSVFAACWLHDTIEDCRITYNDIKSEFGESIANIVYAVTNEKGKNRKERANDKYYDGIRKTDGAIYVKLFDRLANVLYSSGFNGKPETSMLSMYRKENKEFINALFMGIETEPYNEIIYELNNLFD